MSLCRPFPCLHATVLTGYRAKSSPRNRRAFAVSSVKLAARIRRLHRAHRRSGATDDEIRTDIEFLGKTERN